MNLFRLSIVYRFRLVRCMYANILTINLSPRHWKWSTISRIFSAKCWTMPNGWMIWPRKRHNASCHDHTHIGYPDETLDDAKLAEYYENLDINPDKYFQSFLAMNVFGTDKAFNKLRKPVNKTDWIRHARPAVVNAFYSSIENSIRKWRKHCCINV